MLSSVILLTLALGGDSGHWAGMKGTVSGTPMEHCREWCRRWRKPGTGYNCIQWILVVCPGEVEFYLDQGIMECVFWRRALRDFMIWLQQQTKKVEKELWPG